MLKLTSQQFSKIFDALRQSGTSAGSEKRASTRMDVQAKIRIATMEGGSIARTLTGLTRDVSSCGVGMFQNIPIEIGHHLLVCFPCGPRELVIHCTSKFCRPMAEGLFGVGAQFEELAEQRLIDQLQNPAAHALNRIRQSILG